MGVVLFGGVLDNDTVAEGEYIMNARKPLVDYSGVKAVIEKSFTLARQA